MHLIIGLGNPGKKYEKTRHNAGFLSADFLAKKNKWVENKKIKSLIAETEINNQNIIFAKPQTFMNDSGTAVLALQKKYKIKPENTIIIYDELDLPFGTVRTKFGGSSAGHNGIKSIVEKLGIDKFWRIRIGISNDKRALMPTDKFVLSKFNKDELEILNKKIMPEVAEKVIIILKDI